MGRLDVILDPLSGEPAMAALTAASRGARLVQTGNSAGREARLDPGSLRGRVIDVLPFSCGAIPWEERRAAYERALAHAAAGELQFKTRELSLEEVAEAWRLQGESPNPKLLLRPR